MKPKKPNCFTSKISLELAGKLKKDLSDQGFELCRPPYTVFSALKKGITCTLYESGSLVVQGKNKDEFIEFYLEPEILQKFSYTNPHADLDMTPRIGADEAGKGDFFGPLVVASLYADKAGIEKLVELQVGDSKKLSDTKVHTLAKELKKYFRHYIFKLHPEKYNELYKKFGNLNQLLAWMHVSSIQALSKQTGCQKVLLDQFAKEYVVNSIAEKKQLGFTIEQKVRAEEDLVVAAASILARDAFVNEMSHLEEIVSLPLPKGASRFVIDAGRKIIAKYDLGMLDKVSKNHFKTRSDILQS